MAPASPPFPSPWVEEIHSETKMRVAVIGGGVSGLVSAYILAKAGVHVVLYEKEAHLGGHAQTVHVNGVDLDLGFMVFNGRPSESKEQKLSSPLGLGWFRYLGRRQYTPSTRVLLYSLLTVERNSHVSQHDGAFRKLGVNVQRSDMSFSVSLDEGRTCEWGSRNGLSSIFAQKKNAFRPSFYRMLREIIKFKSDVLRYLEQHENNLDLDRSETLGQFIMSLGYSDAFWDHYFIPMCSSVWSCSSEQMLNCSAYCVLSFCRNHHALQVFGRPQWFTVKDRSHSYVNKIRVELEKWSCEIRTGCAVKSILTASGGCSIVTETDTSDTYDGCVMAAHAPDALKILGKDATFDETRVLGAFQYVDSDIYLHHDDSLMPKNPAAWGAWNFLGVKGKRICLTYWLNVVQSLETDVPFFVTLNPFHLPKNEVMKWSTSHPLPTVASMKASLELSEIQGKRGIWFCGAYQGYGFHEDGLKAGMVAAKGLLGSKCVLIDNRKRMTPSLMVRGARLIVTRFLKRYVSTEEGGTVFEFCGANNKDGLKSMMKIHSPLFYWKVATETDLGLADAYISGDISFVDKEEGLLNLFLHLSRRNTIRQARQNITSHYDLEENEDLKVAQMRKISLLIAKARITNKHEVLEIGCGWGSLALEVVKQTGCRYIGITLSEEQLKYAQEKIKGAGFEDQIKLLLCDYRQLPKFQNEMLEAVGHEYMEEFIGCCESLLAEDGIFVLQSNRFVKPSIEHVENIGIHYLQTLLYWRRNFKANKSKILNLGFDEKFIRTWEYYFVYCAAGFKSRTLGNYQVQPILMC
ncbi:Sphingolipid C9-methyltransferase [Nymphaea thermarum]|nr:Sphingolipid C9-methyltransferase [Nymphaea thermarum]